MDPRGDPRGDHPRTMDSRADPRMSGGDPRMSGGDSRTSDPRHDPRHDPRTSGNSRSSGGDYGREK